MSAILTTSLRYLIKKQSQINFELLAKEVYKFVNSLSPSLMSHVFTKRANPYNLRNFQTLYSLKKRAAKSGIETVT